MLASCPDMKFRDGAKAVQLAKMPPDYADLRRVHGKQLYNILGECGWHLLLDTPAIDYGQMLSPMRGVLERAIERMQNEKV